MDRVKADEDLLRRTEAVLAQRSAQMAARKARRFPVYAVRRLAFVATTLLLTVGLSFGGYAYWTTPVAWLDVDINPSVELSVNGLNRVIGATGVNEDGRTVLTDLRLAGRPVDRAVARLVEKAQAEGFVPDGAVVSLTTLADEDKQAPKVARAARKGTDEALAATDTEVEVVEDSVPVTLRDQALASGYEITPGKYNLIRKMMREAGVELDEVTDPKAEIAEYIHEQFGADANPSNVSVAGIMLQTKQNRKGDADKSNNGNAYGKDKQEPTVASPAAIEPENSPSATPKDNGKHKGRDNGNADKGNKEKTEDAQAVDSASPTPSESTSTPASETNVTEPADADDADDEADDADDDADAAENGKGTANGNNGNNGNGNNGNGNANGNNGKGSGK